MGYSESIFRPLGEDLGLRLMTPYSFAKAIAEGAEVTAQDKRDGGPAGRTSQIKVWVFNSQNVTPDVQRVNEIARAHGIPIATVTETLAPAERHVRAVAGGAAGRAEEGAGSGDGTMSAVDGADHGR